MEGVGKERGEIDLKINLSSISSVLNTFSLPDKNLKLRFSGCNISAWSVFGDPHFL